MFHSVEKSSTVFVRKNHHFVREIDDFTIKEVTKKLILRNFLIVIAFYSTFATVWKLQKFSVTLFPQKFRESNGLTKEITK